VSVAGSESELSKTWFGKAGNLQADVQIYEFRGYSSAIMIQFSFDFANEPRKPPCQSSLAQMHAKAR